MKSITFKNSSGETIDVKRGEKGVIKLRHSDINPKRFGQYREYAVRDSLQKPGATDFFAKKGFDVTDPKIRDLMAHTMEIAGAGYMLLSNKIYYLNGEEVAMIRDSIKKLE
jgi:hypothetical protein